MDIQEKQYIKEGRGHFRRSQRLQTLEVEAPPWTNGEEESKVAMGTLIPNLLTQQHILNLTGVQNFQKNLNMKYRTN